MVRPMVTIPRVPPGLEPFPYPSPDLDLDLPKLAVEIDGATLYVDDARHWFSLPADVAVRDRVVYASGYLFSQTFSPVPLLAAWNAAKAVIAHLGRGRIPDPPHYTDADWDVPDGFDA